jgi:glutamyl/glutaminyl-tRNA synthetase
MANPRLSSFAKYQWEGESEEKLVYKLREEGYVPEAICQYLYHLDFGEKGTNKVCDLDDLVKEFDIIKMKAGHQRFDIRALRKINSAHIKQMTNLSYTAFIRPFVKPSLVICIVMTIFLN